MKSRSSVLWLLLVPLAALANGQPAPDATAVRSSLTTVLSLATLGAVSADPRDAQVTRNGADFRIRLPLKGFAAPPDAAVVAVARPLHADTWDVVSMTFPSAGTLERDIPHSGVSELDYTIGTQSTHGRIDPNLVQSSSFATELNALRIRVDQDGHRSEQHLDRYILDGTLAADRTGLLNLTSRSTADHWRIAAQDPNGQAASILVRTSSGRFTAEGVDRAQGLRLMTAMQGLIATPPLPSPRSPFSPWQRQDTQALIGALPGLLTRFAAEEAFDDVRFTIGPLTNGTLGHARVAVAGDSTDGRLNARMEVKTDELAMAGLPPATESFVPHHIALKVTLAGVRVSPLLSLLRAAAEPNVDPVALRAQANILLSDPVARAGIDSLAFDSGPMQVTASLRVIPRASGDPGAAIHVSAVGMDTLLAEAQSNPALQQVLPIMFMVKGIGRPNGAAIVWDIVLGDGPITVNGVPFGQPASRTR